MEETSYPLLADKTMAVFFSLGYSLQTWYDAGIIEREVAPYNRMAEFLHSVCFFTYGGQRDLEYQDKLAANVRVVPQGLRLPPALYALAMPFSQRAILREVDVLKTLQISGAWAALPTKLLFHKPLIIRCGYQHSLNYHREVYAKRGRLRLIFVMLYLTYTFLEWVAYRAADLILLTSERDREYVVSRYRINPAKVKMLPNAIDVKLFRPMPEIKKNPQRLCFVGRLAPEKNLFTLLDAVKGLDVELVLFGDGLLREALQQHTIARGIHNVTFRGRIPNSALPAELNRSAAFLLVSHYEGNPKALLEAMSCGLPVIGSNVDGIRQIIAHGENGYLCPRTVEGIRDAIRTVLSDPTLMAKVGRQARRTIVNRYSLDTLLAKELELLQDLLG
jgi:glycosyltransferase involved in cell wall biosynthesis